MRGAYDVNNTVRMFVTFIYDLEINIFLSLSAIYLTNMALKRSVNYLYDDQNNVTFNH